MNFLPLAYFGAVLSLLGWSQLLARAARSPLQLAILPACCSIIAILFAAGLLHGLLIGYYALMAGGIILAGYGALRDRSFFKRLNDPGIIIVGTIVAILLWANRDAIFIHGDEFTHWGRVSRFLQTVDRFPVDAAEIPFLSYPFGIALLHYFFGRAQAFSETNAIAAQAFILAASLLPLFGAVLWREWTKIIALTIIVCFIGYLFHSEPWNALLVDNVLALVAAGALLIYYQAGNSRAGGLLLIPIIATLPLLKDSGAFLAFLALTVILADLSLRWIVSSEEVKKPFFFALASLAGLLVVRYAWGRHLADIHAAQLFPRGGDQVFTRMAAPEFGPYLAALVHRFVEQIQQAQIGVLPLTLPVWGLVLAALACFGVAAQSTKAGVVRVLSFNLVMAAGCVLYLFGLFYLYAFSFSTYEGARTASFARYVGTFVLLFLASSLVWFLDCSRALRARTLGVFALAAVAAASVWAGGEALSVRVWYGFGADPQVQAPKAFRSKVRDILGSLSNVPASARVYDIADVADTGVQHYAIIYELTPRRTEYWCWSLGPKRFDGDVWTCDMSYDDAAKMLKPYNYMFIAVGDEPFWARYSKLFVDGAQQSGARWFKRDPDTGLFAPMASS